MSTYTRSLPWSEYRDAHAPGVPGAHPDGPVAALLTEIRDLLVHDSTFHPFGETVLDDGEVHLRDDPCWHLWIDADPREVFTVMVNPPSRRDIETGTITDGRVAVVVRTYEREQWHACGTPFDVRTVVGRPGIMLADRARVLVARGLGRRLH